MPRFNVSPEKQRALSVKMQQLEIFEDDIDEKFIKGSGSGGQKINKTNSCVYLKHLPTGTEVKCQQTRSQSLNRFYARRELCELIETELLGVASKREQEREKIRRQKRKRTKRQKEKILEGKRQQASKKQLRKPIGDE